MERTGLGISKAVKDTSMLPSQIYQMKVSHETGSEANFGFGRSLMPSYLEMRPPMAAFYIFRMQLWSSSSLEYLSKIQEISIYKEFKYSLLV